MRLAVAITFSCIIATVSSQVVNGFFQEGLPTVILQGKPTLLARRIHNGYVDEVGPQIQSQDGSFLSQGGRSPVNVAYADGPVEGRRVTVYRRVLRPAKLVYEEGKDQITSQWVGPAQLAEKAALAADQGWYINN